MREQIDLFTEQEVETLIVALGRSCETFTEADAQAVLDWAYEARVNETLLTLALKGNLDIHVRGGEVMFSRART